MSKYSDLVRCMLFASYTEIIRLGESGKEKKKGPDPADAREIIDLGLLADIRSEQVAQEIADNWGKDQRIKIWWASEELEHVYIGDLTSAVVIRIDYDGIDGTAEYMNDRPAGPICSVTLGDVGEDFYNQTVAAGTIVLSDHWLHLLDLESAKSVIVNLITSEEHTLPRFRSRFDSSKLLGDWYPKIAEHMLGKLKGTLFRTGATGVTGFLLAKGKLDLGSKFPFINQYFIGLAADAGDKGNHEQPYLYLMMRIHGGLLLTGTGEEIGNQPISTWSQTEEVFFVLVYNRTHFRALMKLLPGKLKDFQA